MSDERDKGHIRKYSGPEKPRQTTEEYAQKHLNNSAFTNKVPANANSKVKTNKNLADGEPGSAENITPQTNTGENGGKKEGERKKIKIVDKKDNPQIPTFNESAETLTVKDTSQSPTVTTPAKEPPETGAQTLARESENKDMLKEPPKEGDDNGVIEFPNTPSADPTVSDPKTLAREDPNATKEKKEYDPKVDESFVPMNEEEEEKYQGKKQKEWKPSVTSQRIMDAGLAGLNMFGNVLGGANKAFSMLRGLASALTSRQLMSDPTLPARGFLQAMDRSGQIVEDGIKQVGEAYGIKDGVKREDLVGTYKGGQYYKEKQAIEAAEKDYYGKVGTALSDVLGNSVDVNDPVSIQNALSKMDTSQLQDLNEKLFGQNGSLKGMYDGLMTASNPNKVQTTQAKLLQELNKALKGQATDLSRQSGLDRSMANAQLRQVRVGRRQAQDMQQDRISDARRQMKDPASMAGMAPEEQIEVIIRGVLGHKIDNGDIPTTIDANGNEVIDTDALDIQDLNALSQALEGSPIYNDPATHDAADALYQEVRRRVEGAHEQRTQFRQQQRQSRINELMNYPLDYDIADKGGDRDAVGIPRSREGRKRLYRTAWYTQQDLMANGGSQKDIDMCENIMFMCDLAGRRDDAMDSVGKLFTSGAIDEGARSRYMGEINDAYRQAAEALAVTKEDRDARIARNEDWVRGPATERAEMRLDAMETLLEETRTGHMQQEREHRRQQERERALADPLAKRNDRGISLSSNPDYRKKDLQRFSDQLKDVESAMANASSPEEMLRLTREKLDVEEKMRLTHQENHIQRALIDAGALPNAEEVRKQIEGLRGKYTDWSEFGKALNEIRTSNGLKYDTAWSTSRRLEEAQRAQARADAHGRKLDTMIDLMKEMISGQGSINNSIWGSSHQMFSEFEDYLDKKFGGQIKAMGRNRNLLIEEFQNFYTNTIKKDAKEALDGAVSAVTDHMTKVCGDTEATIRGLSEEAQEKFLPMMQEVTGNTARLTRQLKGYYDGTNRDVQSILSTLNEQVSAMENLQATVKGMQPLGGQYVQGPLKIDKDQWEQITAQFQDFDSYRQSVDDLIQAYKSQGQVPSADDLAKAITGSLAGYNPFQQSFEGDEEIRQMLKDLDTTRKKYDQIADNILAFNEGRAQFAVPVDFVDDWNEFQRWKAAGGQAQPQQEASPAPTPAPVPQQEDGRSVSDSEVPPAGAPTENEPYTEEKPVGAQDDTYDADAKFDAAMDRLKEFPELQARLRENPEQIRAMYITDDHNIPIHQTFQNLMRRAVAGKLFGENTGPTIMQMADDLFGQTSNEGFRNARDDWYSIAQSEGTEKEKRDKVTLVTQMATIAGNALKDTFRETAEVNLGIASGSPTPLTGEQEAKERARIAREKSRDIRHFFKLMGEEGDWQTPPGQPQTKPRLTPEQKALQEQQYQQARQDKTDFILGRPSSDAEKRISDMVKDRLFYSKGRPTWKDYDELLTDLENEGTPEATKAYESIINRAILPRLFTLQNNGGAKESGAELQQLVDKAMELGRSGTNRAQAQHFDTKGIVEHMLKGPSSNRTTNGAWNNSFKRAFEAAREWKDLDSRIQSLIDNPDSEGAISKLGPQVQEFLKKNQNDLNEIAEKLKNDGFQNTAQINSALNKLKAMQSKASKLNTDIGAARDKIPTMVHGKFETSKEIPEEALNKIREARRALAEGLTPKGELKEFLAGGKYDKMAQELKEKKYNSQVKDIQKEIGVPEEEAKAILDKVSIEEDPDKTLKEFLADIKAKQEAEEKGGKGGKSGKGANPTGTNTNPDTSKIDEERKAQSRQKAVDKLKMFVRGKTREEQLAGLKNIYTNKPDSLDLDAGMLGLKNGEGKWEPTDENIARIADAVWGKAEEPAPQSTGTNTGGGEGEKKEDEVNSNEITDKDFDDLMG